MLKINTEYFEEKEIIGKIQMWAATLDSHGEMCWISFMFHVVTELSPGPV